ncbi:MAG: T9SS type A sorting domain-containing protein [Bacteroidales bacterium]|nr:T9SS type A sorting domain-containing protein [Bacteroidales bacterium]
MKTLITIILFLAFSVFSSQSQDFQFLWANSYDVSNCNEVGAIAVDSNQNIIISGVHEGPVFIPYKGDIYIIKTDPDGDTIWSSKMNGELILGDMIAMGNNIIIVGQGYGTFSYKGIEYGGASYFLFALMLDAEGELVWYFDDESKYGTYANLSAGENDNFLLHARTQSNLGDWIMIIDLDGNILNEKLLSPNHTLINHVVYYNEKVYMNGQLSGFSGVFIDTVYIPQSPLESTAFVLALDESLTGEWVSIDTTLTNGDGRIVANENGLFAYQETLTPPFNLVKNLKKFDFDGELLKEIVVPSFNPNALILPEIAISDNRIGLFCKNSSNSDNFKLLIFDDELELIEEKVVIGPSDQYSNQMANQGQHFIISHIYTGDLNMNDEITLPYGGSGKVPYIAKIEGSTVTYTTQNFEKFEKLMIYPNPAIDKIHIKTNYEFEVTGISVMNFSGRILLESDVIPADSNFDVSQLAPGVYVLKCNLANGSELIKKLIIR